MNEPTRVCVLHSQTAAEGMSMRLLGDLEILHDYIQRWRDGGRGGSRRNTGDVRSGITAKKMEGETTSVRYY